MLRMRFCLARSQVNSGVRQARNSCVLRFSPTELRALRRLHETSAHYIVGGGQALRHHGVERQVSDTDLYVDVAGNNPSLVFAAVINILGRELPGLTIETLSQPRKRIEIREDGLALDVFTTLPGLAFVEARSGCDYVIQEDLGVPVLSRPDLVRHLLAIREDPERKTKADADLALLGALPNKPLQPALTERSWVYWDLIAIRTFNSLLAAIPFLILARIATRRPNDQVTSGAPGAYVWAALTGLLVFLGIWAYGYYQGYVSPALVGLSVYCGFRASAWLLKRSETRPTTAG